MLHVVIMAGGSGTRFWPESRQRLPKQFLRLSGEETLIQATWNRSLELVDRQRVWVVTGQAHVAETRRQLPELMPDRVLAEPCGRNTAPCIALAALRILADDPDATLLVLPADHVIAPAASFVADVGLAVELLNADPDRLVLFGVLPTYPSTGFGYIRRGERLSGSKERSYAVDGFREKPNLETAESLIAAGGHLWNCGIFVWKARRILDALCQHLPEISPRIEQLQDAWQLGTLSAAIEDVFPLMPSISIDHAVLEKADRVCVVETSFTWDDVGSWQAIARHAPTTVDGNTLIGRVCTTETTNCILRGSGDHLIAAIGVHDLIVVHTPDATLICDRRDESAIRRLREVLEASPETREFL